MSLFYYSDFKNLHSSSNFGDDINPFLMGELFSKEIINSKSLSLMGIGTLLNDKNIKELESYDNVVVFSSGVGYGKIESVFDDKWDFACVRGPMSANALGLPSEKAICDGAILLSDFFDVVSSTDRSYLATFIPHIKTHWSSGKVLKKVSERLGLKYLSPDVCSEDFIDIVSRSKVVYTEAMHGAILADTMRVPWVPLDVKEHLKFKWEDWFLSVGLTYQSNKIYPQIWNPNKQIANRLFKYPYQFSKECLLHRRLKNIISKSPAFLTNNDLLAARKSALYEKVSYINKTYGGVGPLSFRAGIEC